MTVSLFLLAISPFWFDRFIIILVCQNCFFKIDNCVNLLTSTLIWYDLNPFVKPVDTCKFVVSKRIKVEILSPGSRPEDQNYLQCGLRRVTARPVSRHLHHVLLQVSLKHSISHPHTTPTYSPPTHPTHSPPTHLTQTPHPHTSTTHQLVN